MRAVDTGASSGRAASDDRLTPSTWRRNALTRSPWTVALLLAFASPMAQSVAIGGALVFGSGCNEGPTHGECMTWLVECVERCAADDSACVEACQQEDVQCRVDAEDAAWARARDAEAAADIAVVCAAIAVCTLESLESEDASESGAPSLPETETETETSWNEGASDEDSSSPGPPLDLPE